MQAPGPPTSTSAGYAAHVDEIQTITTVATHVDEIQTIATSAINVDEIQTVTTTAPIGATVAGNFSLRYVKSVFIVHVGGTRCVTSSTDNMMKIHARKTWTVEFIRGYIFIFLLYV